MPTDKLTPQCFIDSNIWLYAFIEQQDYRKSVIAKEVIRSHPLVISTQVINEVCLNLFRKTAITESQTQKLIRWFYLKYSVMVLDQTVLLGSSLLREKYSFSFWDSLIVECALQAGVTQLYSEDMQANLLVNDRLHIINPFVKPPGKS